MRKHFVIALIIGLAGAGASFAAELSFGDKLALRNSCGKELRALCGQVEPGEGRMMQCVSDNQSKLSSGCAATIEQLKGKLELPPPSTTTQ